MKRFELCAECEETYSCRDAYDADEVDAEVSKLKTRIKKLKAENKLLKEENKSLKEK